MKTTRLYTLLALLLMAGGVTMQAQELQLVFELVADGSTELWYPIYPNSSNDLLIQSCEPGATWGKAIRISDDGDFIDSLYFWPKEERDDVVWNSTLFERDAQGELCLFCLTHKDDTARLCRVTIHDDYSVSRKVYGMWETPNYWENFDSRASSNAVLNKDGSVVFSFPLENPYFYPLSLRVMRFDASGNICAETTLEGPRCYRAFMLSSIDSVGCRVIMRCPESASDVIYDCLTLDAELNVIAQKHNIDNLAYPVLSCYDPANLRYNPISGKAYSINTFSIPAMNGNPAIYEDIFMSAFDEGFSQFNYAWGIHTDDRSLAAQTKNGSIGFGPEGDVYMIGLMDPLTPDGAVGTNVYVVQFDENLDKRGEIYHRFEGEPTMKMATGICANENNCVFCLTNMLKINNHWTTTGEAFKIPKEAFDGIDEAHDAGFAVAVAYPNPGKDVLNIRTGLKDARVEVYDMSGRMVYRQEITDSITPINTTSWPSGTYIWEVISNGKEAESGKWIKE
jgi:hypothetical protein